MTWDRDTPWRQGSVLDANQMVRLGVAATATADDIAVVATHDCDLAADPSLEPEIELILARKVALLNGTFTHTKNARRLHLPFASTDGLVFAELNASQRRRVAKAALANEIPTALRLAPKDRVVLKTWLGVRYNRPAFPEAFEMRLKAAKLHEKLARALEPSGEWIRALLFDLDEGALVERSDPKDTYQLTIVLLYSTDDDVQSGFSVATSAKQEIEAAFHSKLFNRKEGWRDIELCDCLVVSDEELSFSVWTRLQPWRLDYLSLRADPPQDAWEPL
jgi:hypothetical protein